MAHIHRHNHDNHTTKESHTANKKALLFSFILITTYMVVEFIGGWLTNSLALLSDAGHMLSDSFALGLSLSATIYGAKKASQSRTFGYKRYEILAALLNGIILVLISIFICKEAIERLSDPPSVLGKGMIIISTIGLLINIIVAKILHSQSSGEENLNVRSAYLHVISDLLGSVGAITAAILILLFGWNIADPIASMIVSVLVLYSGWRILKESINVLMESKPAHIDTNEVIETLKAIDGVEDVHDLHIWMITPEYLSMTVHMRVNKTADRDEILETAKQNIIDKFSISHVTIQIEGRELCLYDEKCN